MALLMSPARGRWPSPLPPDVILVGGVPGAGKSTAIAQLAEQPGIRALDPDRFRTGLRTRFPASVPYRWYRPVVHVAQAMQTLAALLRGPGPGRVLLVHDPATRPRRRDGFARLARWRGWRPALVFVDVDREVARRGQRDRGRVVAADCFDGHWARWQELRPALAAADLAGREAWTQVVLVERGATVETVRRMLAGQPLHGVISGSCAETAAATSTSPLTSGAYADGTVTSTNTARPIVV